jgi:hypothetical protein
MICHLFMVQWNSYYATAGTFIETGFSTKSESRKLFMLNQTLPCGQYGRLALKIKRFP